MEMNEGGTLRLPLTQRNEAKWSSNRREGENDDDGTAETPFMLGAQNDTNPRPAVSLRRKLPTCRARVHA